MSKFYVVCNVMPWTSLRLEETGRSLRFDEIDSAGFLLAYTTREAAEVCVEEMGGTAEILVFESSRAALAEGEAGDGR